MTQFKELFGVIDGRMQKLTWIRPSPVEICSDVVTPVMSIDNSIRVQHGNNLKDERFSQLFGLFVVLLE